MPRVPETINLTTGTISEPQTTSDDGFINIDEILRGPDHPRGTQNAQNTQEALGRKRGRPLNSKDKVPRKKGLKSRAEQVKEPEQNAE